MSQQYRNTRAEISHSHLIQNLHALQSLQTEGEFLCPMVKCNAYGHGAVAVSQWLVEEGVGSLGVALVEEALELRAHGIVGPDILVFGTFPPEAVPAFIEHQLTPVISNFRDLEALGKQIKPAQNLSVHLKIDTGMHRLGLDAEEVNQIPQSLKRHSGIQVKGVCTHFACAEDIGDPHSMSRQQLLVMSELEGRLGLVEPVVKHVLNSTALIGRKFHLDGNLYGNGQWSGLGCRPGISLYGCLDDAPLLSEQGQSWLFLNLKPVMTLIAELVKIKELSAGESLSYGATWQATKPSRVGVLAIGYGDGYPRLLSNRGKVLVRGSLVPVIGRVCMDYTLVDLSDLESDSFPQPGDEMILFGDKDKVIEATDLAQQAGTISYEIFTGISSRVPRVEV